MKLIAVLTSLLMTVGVFAQTPGETVKGVNASESSTSQSAMSVNIQPFFLIIGELKGGVMFRLSDRFFLGPVLGYMPEGEGFYTGAEVITYSFQDATTKRETLGLRLEFLPRGANKDGFFTAAAYESRQVEVSVKTNSAFSDIFDTEKGAGTGSFQESKTSLTAGYRRQWDGFAVIAGGGI